ncbi:MAG: hypothetical protein ACLSD6_06755 [Clostridium sp.]
MVNIVINQEIEFLEEKSAWQGVKRVAGYVRNDMERYLEKSRLFAQVTARKARPLFFTEPLGKVKD